MTTPPPPTIRTQVLIFGGGAAGLWLLDELRRNHTDAWLLEAHQLGSGQTVASQGIIHGGTKYSLIGAVTGSAKAISAMPDLWRSCLAGQAEPDLSAVRIRAQHCHLWRSTTLKSRLGFIGAKKALRVTPIELPDHERPAPLRQVPGTVLRLDEQVIAADSLIETLAKRHADRLLSIAAPIELTWRTEAPGRIAAVTLNDPLANRSLTFHPQHVVFTAGQGNATLRQAVGLSAEAMQRRPLHMVMLRGNLPALNGHCIDGQVTRVTITSDVDTSTSGGAGEGAGRTIWQVGGQVSEDGVKMEPQELVAHAKRELTESLPGLTWDGVQWSTYRVDRAEGKTPAGRRPELFILHHEGNVLTAWPTKLVLAPELARTIVAKIEEAEGRDQGPGIRDQEAPTPDSYLLPPTSHLLPLVRHWPRPTVARPPWETTDQWFDAP